jgi:cytochrome bd-type quinol oxidase subunit 2
MVILQMAFAFYGYGISKLPYLLYPYIKVSDSGVMKFKIPATTKQMKLNANIHQ